MTPGIILPTSIPRCSAFRRTGATTTSRFCLRRFRQWPRWGATTWRCFLRATTPMSGSHRISFGRLRMTGCCTSNRFCAALPTAVTLLTSGFTSTFLYILHSETCCKSGYCSSGSEQLQRPEGDPDLFDDLTQCCRFHRRSALLQFG